MERDLVCVVCPMSCALKVRLGEDGSVVTTGNRCPRGARYAAEEFLDPRRVVSATARLRAADAPGPGDAGAVARVPVRTSAPFPKERVNELLKAVYALEVALPVRRGQVLIADALGTGVDVVATRTLPFPPPET
ncbi:MAG: DUF1667 domain-containing protein [Spirochaetales bacterium]|nr:DUF1667 domain-containing protein [Spirochaetales bacterium]